MMKKSILLVFLCVWASAVAQAQWPPSRHADAGTTISETAYQVVPSYGGRYKVMAIVVAVNPFEDQFASNPGAMVVVRAADGSVITTSEVTSAGIPPKGRIAFVKELFADEPPSRVDFRLLRAGYENTIYRPSDLKPLQLRGERVFESQPGQFRLTGEIVNPYPGETGAWLTLLFRDGNGKPLGGHSLYLSTVLPVSPRLLSFTSTRTNFLLD